MAAEKSSVALMHDRTGIEPEKTKFQRFTKWSSETASTFFGLSFLSLVSYLVVAGATDGVVDGFDKVDHPSWASPAWPNPEHPVVSGTPTPEPPAVVPEVAATPAPEPAAVPPKPPAAQVPPEVAPIPGTQPQESIQGPNDSWPAPIPGTEEQESIQGPNGSGIDEPPTEPKAKFVTKDQYELSKLNLGGVDTDGDGIKDGVANPVSINDPTPTDVYNFKDSISIPLTDGQAKMALVDGGFVKDGVTYEIWESKSHPGQYEIVAVDKDHPLAGNVINVDTAILTPDVEEPSATEAPTNTEVTPDESPNETYPTDVREDLEYSFGLVDPETGEPVPGTGQAGLAQAIYDVGFFRPEDYLGQNPFTEGTLKHHQWQRIHDFMVRHLN